MALDDGMKGGPVRLGTAVFQAGEVSMRGPHTRAKETGERGFQGLAAI